MNEAYQLAAIERELKVAGWQVWRDAQPAEFGLPEHLPSLDFFARMEKPAGNEAPMRLIVEVANRRRKHSDPDIAGQVHPIVADEDEALRRLDAIGDGLDGLAERDIAFQVRFLDVSADQAEARLLRKFSVRNDEALRNELRAAVTSLKAPASLSGERSLVIAITWCRWVRILGIRFPAKARKQLIDADIRTIQKDLYDAGIVATAPGDYFLIHQSLMALVEGGDVDWRALAHIKDDLHRLLAHLAVRLDMDDPFVAERVPSRGRQGIEVFDAVEVLLHMTQDAGEREPLLSLLVRLRETDGTPAFRQALIDFERAVPDDLNAVTPQLSRLRALTDTIRD